MNDQYFSLFSNCVPILGRNRAIIYDLQFQRYKLIPKLLFHVLLIRGLTVGEVKKKHENKYDKGIENFFEKLVNEQFGFYMNGSESFPEIKLDWNYPGLISNAIIDIDTIVNLDFHKIFRELQACNCNTVQLRFNFAPSLTLVYSILELLENSKIKGVEIFAPFSNEFSFEKIDALTKKNKRVRRILFHDFNSNHEIYNIDDVVINFTTNKINYIKDCGYISIADFYPNMIFFTEAFKFNTCLNRKVAINCNGEIMNCPSMNKIYGNIRSCSIERVVKTKEFQSYWSIKKDEIATCNICEFRYMCSDCRAFTVDKSLYGKPSKCTYTP
ncbi:MAG: grasp-with-spasm system SPASM domain peptide maturase [Bacteroidetes bacterium 4484_276]|nr:MAG: grasp-with-spasm system SPASM domain peptide maturase [Bacteroidetes bacterium 4484_276]